MQRTQHPTVAFRLLSCPPIPSFSAPSAFHNLAAHISTSLFLLGDAASTLTAGSDAVSNTLSDAAAAVGDAAPAVAEVAKKNGGFFGAFASAFETFLKVLDQGIEKVGIPYRCVGVGAHDSFGGSWQRGLHLCAVALEGSIIDACAQATSG
jgi:hypothetical protein